MTNNNLNLKTTHRFVILIILLCAVGLTNAFADNHDFSAETPNGQILYYKITNATEHTVMVTHPCDNYNFPYYDFTSFIRPSGDLIIPYYVEYNGVSYSVTAIDSNAFGSTFDSGQFFISSVCTGLASVIIPASVQTIGDRAFANCTGLTTVTIPTSVTEIGESTFYSCNNLVTVNFNATNCSSIGGNTWNGCTSFTTLNIGNTVTRIPDNGFQGATALASVTIPKKVATVGDYGFEGCTNLTNVTFANNSTLATIGQYTFYGCTNLTNVIFGNNSTLTTIGQYAFCGCTNLTDVTFNETSQLNTIDNYAFQNCSHLATINLPNTLTSIGNYAFNGCSLLQSTTESQLLPNALETIGDYAFQNASTLAYIRIPSTVTSIGKYAFKSCTALNTVDFEATNCTYSGTQAEPPFFYCSALARVRVSDNVTQIPAYCFKDCTSLTNLTLRDGLTEINNYAFYGCININSLILPVSVTSIGSFAFGNAYDMEIANVVSLNAIPPTIGEEAVFPAVQTIYVPWNSVSDYESAEYWEDYFIEGMVYKNISGYSTSTTSDKWAFIASPLVEDADPTTVDNLITETQINYDLYRFNQRVELEWENYKEQGEHYHFDLENGRGYLYANAEDVNLIFKGTFNENETEEVGLVHDAGNPFAGWNLVGNPFPVQAYANRSYYVMNEDGTAIEPVAVSSEVAIEPCTGVMVKAEATETNPKVTFSKTAPDSQGNQGVLQIAVAQNNTRGPSTGSVTVMDKAIVSFNDGDALGKFVFNEDNAKIWIPRGNEDFAIVCAEKTGEMPLNFEAKENGTYTISVNPESVEMDYLHLIDNLTGVDVDLLQTPVYTFDAKKSDYASRFKLVFATNEENGPSTGSGTFAFYNGNEWVVSNTGEATLQIVDMMGRVMSSEPINGNATISLNQTPGVYMLRLVSGDSVKVQKVVVR